MDSRMLKGWRSLRRVLALAGKRAREEVFYAMLLLVYMYRQVCGITVYRQQKKVL